MYGNVGVKSFWSPGTGHKKIESCLQHPKENVTLNALHVLVTKESKQSLSQALSVSVLEPVVKTIYWIL